jgi:putative tryptophan/tyrosine transport system substrate-binding protein
MAMFRQGLSEIGYVEGRNVVIEYRWAENQNDRLPMLAADLVRRQVAVIAAAGLPAALAAKAATTTISIVFEMGTDPVTSGFVASLNRPGGNLTGVNRLNVELLPKRLQILHEVVPSAAVITFLTDSTNPRSDSLADELAVTARSLGVRLDVLKAGTNQEIDAAFLRLAQSRNRALLIGTSPFFNSRVEQFAMLAVRHSVPAIYQVREFPAAGGLMSYGASLMDAYHQFGIYTGRILKGDKPADLPVQEQTKIQFVINNKTAKALEVEVPIPLIGRADEVIE